MTSPYPSVLIHFVGAGPGDAELITVKGARLLGEAGLVVYAGSLVDRALVEHYAPNAEIHDSAGLTLEQTTALLAGAAAAGRRAVRLHTGDPALYGAIQEQMAELDRLAIAYAVVPGVTSAFAAAAALRQELTLPEVSQTLILTRLAGRTPVPEGEGLARLAAAGATMVIYLSVGMIDGVVAELLRGAYTAQTPVAVVAKASWPDEQVVEGTLADIAAKVRAAGIDRQAVILVGEVLNARRTGLTALSKLYAADFTHGFRVNSGTRAQEPETDSTAPQPHHSPFKIQNSKSKIELSSPHPPQFFALTRNGSRLGARLQAACPGAALYVPARFAAEGVAQATPFSGELKHLVARLWPESRAMVFIMATGIVVRTVAPLLAGKERDPAVLVLDEGGQFVVPLLSGHLGGANQLARELAAALGAAPVITTATDVNGLTAWDEAARLAGLAVEPLGRIKELNCLLLEGQRIDLVDERGLVAVHYAAAPGVERQPTLAAARASGATGVVVVTSGSLVEADGQPTLCLRPRTLVAGIGCNRGTSAEELEAVLRATLAEAGLAFASLAVLASIGDKADEPGLLAFAARHRLPLEFFSAGQLNAVEAPSPASSHALAAVGARGVCEPAAILAAGGGPLLVGKQKSGNVTVAVAEMSPLRIEGQSGDNASRETPFVSPENFSADFMADRIQPESDVREDF